jgi:IS5 family transposase
LIISILISKLVYENTKKLSLADSICDLRARKIKKTFFTQINILIDWDSISSVINKDYLKRKSATEKHSYLQSIYQKY